VEGPCEQGKNFELDKMRGISWPAEKPSSSIDILFTLASAFEFNPFPQNFMNI
jgi:hypothetical protein